MKKYYYTSKKNGLELHCNRCGKTEYVKRLKNSEVAGGVVIPEEYEAPTVGWVELDSGEDLCPECSAKEMI